MQPTKTEPKAFDRVRTSVSTSFEAGVSAKVISERLGHATVAFTQDVYIHSMPGREREAADTIAALILGAAEV
jgi:integrase